MSPRIPTLSVNWPLRPPPIFTPRSFVDRSLNNPSRSTLARIKPRPVDRYGRRPVPGGALNNRLVISVVTLLSPNSKLRSPAVSSKKFGDQPKSTSKPTTLGFQPIVAPKSMRRSTSSSTSGNSPKDAEPPKLAPTKGETNQLCADAETGNSDNDTKLIIKSLRTCIIPPRVCQKRHPLHSSAICVPHHVNFARPHPWKPLMASRLQRRLAQGEHPYMKDGL